MTIADIAMWRLLGWISGGAIDGVSRNILDSYKQLKSNYEATSENKKIKAYLKEKYPNKF